MEEKTAPQPIGSRFRPRLFVFLLLFLLLVGFIILWLTRTAIAENIVRSELDKLSVEASYEIEDIGFNKQVIRNLVIGDPDRPDLTADHVEVGNSLTLKGAGINWISANGVKLFGQLADGKLSFGELDKFTDPEDDSPLTLPDIWLGLSDAKLRIDSDYGALGFSLNGEGNLQDGFEGELAAISKNIDFGGCKLANPSYFGKISITDRRPSLTGPLRLPGLKCTEMALSAEDMAAELSLELGEAFDAWTGSIGLIGGPLKYAGYSAQEVRSSIDFSGDIHQSSGTIDLTSSGILSPYGGADIGRINGPFELGYGEQFSASFEGEPVIQNARLSKGMIAQIGGITKSAAATPVAPLAEKLSAALMRAGRSMDLSGNMQVELTDGSTNLIINALEAESRSGALLALNDPLALGFGDGNIRMLGDADIRLAGGGLPEAALKLRDGSLRGGFAGQLEMASYQAESAELHVPILKFAPTRGGGTSIDGRILMSGALPDGRVTGLQLPISGSLGSNGQFALLRQCVDLQFASLRSAALVVGPTKTRLCPNGGAILSSNGSRVNVAANASGLKIKGSIGGTPLALTSGELGFSFQNGLSARNLSIRLGQAGFENELDMALLTAAFGRQITGKMSGASGQVAGVPLLMEEISGDWRYANGVFSTDARLLVRDEEQVERFRPLISNDVRLTFANNKIVANGLLLEPKTLRPVATVNMDHFLGNNSGQALLDVGALTFDETLQPEMLTPLTLGVIANVFGTVSGTGQINWDNSGDGVRSTGRFRTDSVNLAAAFGPVTGLSGEISFSDLLGLETAPGQLVNMAEVNPGVAAFNGTLHYRLLPDYKMEIEGGQWPFAGGTLYLEPTILDLGEEAERRLEFTVVGVDAAQFLTQFEFENLSATGVFDGKLPMVFDQDGGRVAGGYLVAREGGGTLAYIGELTYEDMGTFANFAFNALRSLKYDELTIGMNGAIDGEIITEVKFSGLQQGDDAARNFITKQLARIPIEFNVRIQAPFMQLVSSAKAYYEPEILVGQNLPALLRAQEARASEAAEEIKE